MKYMAKAMNKYQKKYNKDLNLKVVMRQCINLKDLFKFIKIKLEKQNITNY